MEKLEKYHIDDEVLLVHKPISLTSFDFVARMRKVLNTKKVGHAGTLDPLASGLMIIGYNKGTKKMNTYVGLDKIYLAEIIIGKSTTTGDREGEVLEQKIPYMKDLSIRNCEVALETLLGEHFFPAPLYSAVKVAGKPLYKYAREGIEPPFIPEKKMELKRAFVLDVYKQGDVAIVKIRAHVGSGTYIRTLAEEFGKHLGYPASLKSLHRFAIGEYYDYNAFRLEETKKKEYAILKVYPLIKKTLCRFFFKQKK